MSRDSGGFQVILRMAISGGSVDEVIDLMDDPQFDPDDRDTYHDLQTFLMKLCHVHLQPDEEAYILEKLDGSSLDFTIRDAHGRTALIHACIGDNINIVQFITTRHPDVAASDNEGNNVLVYAIKNGNCDIIEHLLECDRKSLVLMSSQNNLGLTAMDFARRTDNIDLVKLLEVHMPTHPSVKVLRRCHEKGLPCQPLPAFTPATRSGTTGNSCPSNRVPFHHSKSWDIDDRTKNASNERTCYSVNVDAHQPQYTSHNYLRMSENEENTLITLSSKERGPRVVACTKHSVDTKLPEIVTKQSKCGPVERKKGKKDSTSLPDLRNLTGSLVATRTGSKAPLTSQESLTGSEDVFEPDKKSNSSIVQLPVLMEKNSRKTDVSLTGLARTRKKSSSAEDVIHTSVLF